MDNFFDHTVDDELVQQGQLHAYLLPSRRTNQAFAHYCKALKELEFLAPQPPDALHLTVGRFKQADTEELRSALPALVEAQPLRSLSPLTGTWHTPTCENSSVIVRCDLPGWRELVEAAEASAQSVLGAEVAAYPPPFAAHLTLAYGIASGEDEAALRCVDATSRALGERYPKTEQFHSVAWCLVVQHAAAGTYTFEVLAATELA